MPPALSQLDRGGFWPLLTFGYADKHASAIVQTGDARPLKRWAAPEAEEDNLSGLKARYIGNQYRDCAISSRCVAIPA